MRVSDDSHRDLSNIRFRSLGVGTAGGLLEGINVAHSKQARKRVNVNDRKARRNRVYRSASRTLVRRAFDAIEAGDPEAAQEAVARAIRQLDRTASRGVIHKNNAARRKSRLMARFNRLQASV
jgi:small subunit ribosomal protein S20